MKIVTREEMERAEKASGVSIPQLMERAGLGVAAQIKKILGAPARKIVFLIGPGNNGGDGLVAAYHLHNWGAKALVFLTSPRSDEVFKRVESAGISISMDIEQLRSWLREAEAVVDALFGTGKIKPISGIFQEALRAVAEEKGRRKGLKIFALDLPSGLDADRGAIDPSTLTADFTLTIGFPKRGLFYFPGASKVGKIRVIDIGLPHLEIKTELLTPEKMRSLLPQRPINAHKGTFGRVLIIGGSENYIGAACLAALGAYRIGAGLVTLSSPKSLHPIFASKLTEATHIPVPEDIPGFFSPKALIELKKWLPNYDAFVIGCGLGQGTHIREFLLSLLQEIEGKPLVLDADGLNNLSKVEGWWERVPGSAILTPHPGEMSRLCQLPVSEVERDRIESARNWSIRWGKVIVLKGAFTVIASPDGQVRLSPFANPLLASGGTGDVLSGIIGGLLAQGLSPFDAACLGVYIHGLSAELLRDRFGESGLIASDLLENIPMAVKHLKNAFSN